MTMRVGVILPLAESDGPGRVPAWSETLLFARHAEAVGVDSIWVYDHMYGNEPGSPPSGMHEAWSVLAALAAVTDRVELGQLVMCMSFRNPGLLAKMAVTVDEISRGRLTLGLGAGWHDQEYRAFGYPIDHRVSRFEEGLEVVIRLLRGETVMFSGQYVTTHDAVLLPAPTRSIPILIAAKGPRMLKLTARRADAWNTAWFTQPDDRFRGRLADFKAAMLAERRHGGSVRVTVGVEVGDTELPSATARIGEMLTAFSEAGTDDVIVVLQPMTTGALDRLGEALAQRSAHR